VNKQSLRGQVSAELTAEICINNVSSYSRLTAADRQATAVDTILRTVSRLFFFFFSLPLMREQLNQADSSRQASHSCRYHSQNCLQTLFFLFLPTFDKRTTELHLQAEKLTETVLHLNLGH
jgi:hypothetical protein